MADIMRGDVLTVTGRYLTADEADRAVTVEALRQYLARHEPDRPLTTLERDAIVYENRWPTRTYTVTEAMRVDTLTGVGTLGITPRHD